MMRRLILCLLLFTTPLDAQLVSQYGNVGGDENLYVYTRTFDVQGDTTLTLLLSLIVPSGSASVLTIRQVLLEPRATAAQTWVRWRLNVQHFANVSSITGCTDTAPQPLDSAAPAITMGASTIREGCNYSAGNLGTSQCSGYTEETIEMPAGRGWPCLSAPWVFRGGPVFTGEAMDIYALTQSNSAMTRYGGRVTVLLSVR